MRVFFFVIILLFLTGLPHLWVSVAVVVELLSSQLLSPLSKRTSVAFFGSPRLMMTESAAPLQSVSNSANKTKLSLTPYQLCCYKCRLIWCVMVTHNTKSLHTPTAPNEQTPLTSVVQSAARVLSLLGYVLLVVALEDVFTHDRGRATVHSGGVTAVPVPPACLEIEDIVNGEFQRGDGSAWCVHFVHILQRVSPFLVYFRVYPRI